MQKIIGLVKIHYIDYKGKESDHVLCSHVWDLQEFTKAVSLYRFLKDNEVECNFNEMGRQVPEAWGNVYEVFVDDFTVTLGNDEDLWVLDVYVK